MARSLVDLLWRDSALAPTSGRRGPRAKYSVGEVVDEAIAICDADGLTGLTVRRVADALGMSTMSVYTHVNSRDDLLVLMVDEMHARAVGRGQGWSGRASGAWRTRVRTVAEDNKDLLRAHPWMLEVDDPRTALGPGTIAKYDHELAAFDGTGLDDLQRDAALSFVLDFVEASSRRLVQAEVAGGFGEVWAESADPLAAYVGEAFPLARRVGRAAGEAHGGPYDARAAWEFGLARVMAGLEELAGRG
ncbi:MAG: TetR/AcrR family transcriptional regulator [Nocardioides sp.]|uniref:TetR/AcrR family transcriptional regulator n=1 Tax=Nocardioides sp. TaxID=35761 RepID=UPI003F07B074